MSKGYKALEMKSKIQINKFLATKSIINQTDYVLSDHKIEVLALGTKFVFRFPPSDNDDKAAEREPTERCSQEKSSAAGASKAAAYTHPEIVKALKSLTEQKEFKITKSHEVGVVVLWKRPDYEKEALRQLSDKDNYQLVALETNSRLIHQAM